MYYVISFSFGILGNEIILSIIKIIDRSDKHISSLMDIIQ